MIDITPDIMLHKRLYSLDLTVVDTLCITHSHTDHLNIADLCFRSTKHYVTIPNEKPIAVYANKKSCEVIKKGMVFDFGLPEDDSLSIQVISAKNIIQSAELKVIPINARHDTKEDCLFYLIQEGELAFIQINDSGLPGEEFELALTEALGGRKLSAVSMDCTFCLEAGKASHMGVAENITLKKRLLYASLANEKTLFFANHFSHNGHASHKKLSEALSPHGIAPAHDGMVLNL
jgi:phosphoribosyl 1,2-cyclic phosphate phosphodiesterase